MNDTAFSEWVRISGDKIIVYTHPKQYRIFVWGLFFISQLVLVYKVYDQEQEPWLVWLLIPLGIVLLFYATRKVIFKLKEQTFAVKIYGITFCKKTWQKTGMYTIRQRFTQDDNMLISSRSRRNNAYLLHLHFDVGRVWVIQAKQAADLKPLGIALQEMLEAKV